MTQIKKITLSLLTFFMGSLLFAQEYSIKGNIKGINEGEIFLGYYYGDKQYVKDTVKVINGSFEFTSENNLPSGMYFILLPNQEHFQLVIDQTKKFYLESNISNLIGQMKIKGSNENERFYQYQKFTQKKGFEAGKINNKLIELEKDSLEKIKMQLKLEKLNDEVQNFKNEFIKINPTDFFTKLLIAMDPIQIPKSPLMENGKVNDRFAFNYFKSHYWDNYDLTDDRMIRTPIFHNKMEKYLNEYTLQFPDSINQSLDKLIEKVRPSKELFKYVINWSTHHYESSKIMGHDAVFVHLVFNYFITQQTPWIDEVQLTNIIDKAMRISPNLIGRIAPEIELPDDKGEVKSLSKIESKFTALFFYDPDCGHCKTETPKVNKIVKKYTEKEVSLYAVCTEFDENLWRNFIDTQDIENWINVIDLENKSNFRGKYNVLGTPRLYLLDENKKIIAKQIDSISLEEILENEFKKLAQE